ncbi:hypothetical protein HKD37_06G017352 [Glycine soja]
MGRSGHPEIPHVRPQQALRLCPQECPLQQLVPPSVILNIWRRDDWFIDVIRSHNDLLPPYGCSRPSTLRSIIEIITISSAHTSANNLT